MNDTPRTLDERDPYEVAIHVKSLLKYVFQELPEGDMGKAYELADIAYGLSCKLVDALDEPLIPPEQVKEPSLATDATAKLDEDKAEDDELRVPHALALLGVMARELFEMEEDGQGEKFLDHVRALHALVGAIRKTLGTDDKPA